MYVDPAGFASGKDGAGQPGFTEMGQCVRCLCMRNWRVVKMQSRYFASEPPFTTTEKAALGTGHRFRWPVLGASSVSGKYIRNFMKRFLL